jgi:hypothetical protein
MAIVNSRKSVNRRNSQLYWGKDQGRGPNSHELNPFSNDTLLLILLTIVIYLAWSLQHRIFWGWALIDFLTPWIVYLSLRKDYFRGLLCAVLLGLLFEGSGTVPVWSGVFWFGILHNFIFLIKPYFSWTKKETWLSVNAVSILLGASFFYLAAVIRGHQLNLEVDALIWVATSVRLFLSLGILWLILKKQLHSIVATDRKAIAEAFE